MKFLLAAALAVMFFSVSPDAWARRSSAGSHRSLASAGIRKTRDPQARRGRVHATKYYRSGHPRNMRNTSPKRSPFNIQEWGH